MSGYVRAIAVMVILVAAVSVVCGKHQDRPGEFHDAKNAFSMIPPKDWETRENVMGLAVFFLSPLRGPDQLFRENINVSVEKLPASIDLDAYMARSQEVLAKMVTDYKKISSSRTTVNGLAAGTLLFEHRMGQLTLRCLDYLFVINGRGYVITCTALTTTYADYAPTFETACKTFQAD